MPAPFSRSRAASSATTARSRARSIWDDRRRTSSRPSAPSSKGYKQGWPPPNRATPAKTSPTPSLPCCANRAWKKTGGWGYPMGGSYPPDWGERTMSLRPGDLTVLQPGMTFHFMPGLWLDDWGLEVTESILITETGVETFCNTPRRLFVKE